MRSRRAPGSSFRVPSIHRLAATSAVSAAGGASKDAAAKGARSAGSNIDPIERESLRTQAGRHLQRIEPHLAAAPTGCGLSWVMSRLPREERFTGTTGSRSARARTRS